MRRLPRALLTLLAVLTLCACGDKAQDGSNGEDAAVAWDALSFDKTMPLDYAAQFSVSYAGDEYKRITIGQDQKFLLVTEGAAVPSGVPEGVTVLRQPLDEIYLVASAAMDSFAQLDAVDSMKDILVDSCSTTATVMFITMGATLFGYVLTRARLDLAIKDFMLNITGGSTVIFFIIVNIVLLIAGCFLDSTSALYIFTPLFAPVALQLGIDPIHLGTVMIVNLAIGLFTPPVGVNLYVACGIGDIKIEEITKGIIPCLLAELAVLLLVTYIPDLSLMFVG